MIKQDKNQHLPPPPPQIRFKQDDGSDFPDWEERRLGDIGKIKMCKRVFSNQTTEVGDIPFYKISTFGKKADAFISYELYADYKNRFSFPKVGEILISASGTLGRTVIYDGSDSYYQDSNIVWIENDEKLVYNVFLYYIYQIVRYDSEGGTIQRLYNSIISNTKFYSPTLPEQQKIASFLQSVDTKIQLLERKVVLLQSYKKGIMQKLFSQELRFKDDQGNEYPDWEERRLGEVVTKVSSDITLDSLKELRGTYAVYGAAGEIKRVDFFRETEPYVAIVKDGAVGKIHLCSPYSSVLGTLDIIKPKKEKINVYFLYSVLQRIVFSKYIIGSVIPHIYFKDYSQEKVLLPTLPEQQKIASFLQSLDTKISLTQKQVALTKLYKKGLLQRMFV